MWVNYQLCVYNMKKEMMKGIEVSKVEDDQTYTGIQCEKKGSIE